MININITATELLGFGLLCGFMVSSFMCMVVEWKRDKKEIVVESSKWYLREQCQRIRDDLELINELTETQKIKEIIQNIIVTSFKIEADATGKDLYELINQ